MLNIFAIDPKICQSLVWFRYCTEHCHPSHGRAIADLPPGQWCQEAKDVVDLAVANRTMRPVKGQSLKRDLDRKRDRLVHRPGTTWDYMEPSWVVNAEQEHRRDPFPAAISPDYPEGQNSDRRFHPDDLDESQSAWMTPSGRIISRSRFAFCDAILPVLCVASKIHFLDSRFNIDSNSRYTENYRRIIETLATHCEVFPEFVIHCCPDANLNLDDFESELARLYQDVIPIEKSITCVVWKTNIVPSPGAHPFHNRYVITDRFGVVVGYGTDSANSDTEAPDSLQFIDALIHRDLFQRSRNRTHPMVTVRKEIVIPNV